MELRDSVVDLKKLMERRSRWREKELRRQAESEGQKIVGEFCTASTCRGLYKFS